MSTKRIRVKKCFPDHCGMWLVLHPSGWLLNECDTHAEAIAYAHQQATKETRP